MATDLYPNVNSVVSNIIEEDVKEQAVPPSPNAILIFGTATQGNLYSPTRVDTSTITDLFGTVPNDPYYNTSLVKGFYEIKQTIQNAEVIAVRIGAAKRAALALYETRRGSGEYAPFSNSVDTPSISFEAKADGPAGNNIFVTVIGNPSGEPVKMEIEDANTGVTVDYDLSMDGSVPGAYSRVSSLAQAINANSDLNTVLKATPNVIAGSYNITITQMAGSPSGSTLINTSYQLNPGVSAGDNILNFTSVFSNGSYTDSASVAGGTTSAILAQTPVKVSDVNVDTITSFYSIVQNEVLIGPVVPGQSGVQNATVVGTAGLTGIDNTTLKDFVLYRTSAVNGQTTVVSGANYTISGLSLTINAGVINPHGDDADVGDVYFANYKFSTTFAESKTRSGIQAGDRYSYFVAGNTITFGAAQVYSLELDYSTQTQFTIPGDVQITDAANNIVKFVNPPNYPAIGDTITVEYLYEPELPMVTGGSLKSGEVQAGQLSGGDDGRRMTTAAYYNELIKGFAGADNIPCRLVVPQGVYLDDTMEGIDYETGMPVTTNAQFHLKLIDFIKRKSQYVSECEGIISTRPLSATNPANPSVTEKENWYNSLVTVSSVDTTRAANVMNAVDDFHLVVTAGDMVGSLPQVLGGRSYVPNSANVFAAMKYAHDNLSAMINKRVPATWITGLIYPIITSDRINAVNGMRYTLFTNHAFDGSIIIADAPTAARPASQFTRQYVVDIIFEAVNAVRQVLDPFIGQPNTNATRQAMETTAKIVLQAMSPAKLQALDVQVAPTGSAISGTTTVKLLLTTAVEVRKIALETRVRLGQ